MALSDNGSPDDPKMTYGPIDFPVGTGKLKKPSDGQTPLGSYTGPEATTPEGPGGMVPGPNGFNPPNPGGIFENPAYNPYFNGTTWTAGGNSSVTPTYGTVGDGGGPNSLPYGGSPDPIDSPDNPWNQIPISTGGPNPDKPIPFMPKVDETFPPGETPPWVPPVYNPGQTPPYVPPLNVGSPDNPQMTYPPNQPISGGGPGHYPFPTHMPPEEPLSSGSDLMRTLLGRHAPQNQFQSPFSGDQTAQSGLSQQLMKRFGRRRGY